VKSSQSESIGPALGFMFLESYLANISLKGLFFEQSPGNGFFIGRFEDHINVRVGRRVADALAKVTGRSSPTNFALAGGKCFHLVVIQ